MSSTEAGGHRAPALPVRHTFTSIFLLLFLLDGIVGLLVGTAYLLGRDGFQPGRFDNVLIPFSIALLMGALVQVALSFSRRMRWSARIIGLYVVGYWAAQMAMILVVGLILLASRGADAGPPDAPILSDPVIGGVTLAISGIQVLVGIWAARDLSGGHYLQP